jgi:ABC-type oligopeptide transport system substrate-binding subunit/class 3 adenylate cyclase
MTIALLPALAAYIPRDRVENLIRPGTPLPEEGVALIADISGFTPLTEALTRGLSPDQGAEELTRALDGVFTPLIAEIQAFHGSVIKFGGDALIVWYPREPRTGRATVIHRAITSAWRMQQAIKIHGQVPTPIGIVTLKMKVGLTYGPIKRFNLGLPRYGYEDVLGGATLDRMAEAEHHAEAGDIMLDAATLAFVSGSVRVAEWREDFAVVGQLQKVARPKPWPPLTWQPEAEEALVEMLTPYVPAQLHETLATGRVQVAELKPVVSLFVQFHGIDYDADPQVGPKLQQYFSTAQTVAVRYGGRVNRLITGDKGSLIHVIFGAPRSVEEQEARAIRCALDLQAECGGLPFIQMQRIGVTVGRVFAGPIGSPDRHDYTTMGDSINLSARLMQNAADHQVLMEKAVRDKLGPAFEVADLGTIMVKGKSQPIPVFAALAVQSQTQRPAHQEARLTGSIFGREQELTQLRATLDAGQGKIILLTGDVGMGKTMLLDVLRAEVFQAGPIGWADGICLAYGQTFSGYLFTDLLRDLLELPPGAGPAETSQFLALFCQNLFGPARLESTYPYLARFMGLPLSGELAQRLEGLSGESVRWQLFELFQELFDLLLNRRPWVVALDDLQWADPTSLHLVEALLPLTVTQPLILLLALRPERDSKAWSLRQQILTTWPEQVIEVNVGSLDDAAATALLTHYAPQLSEPAIAYLLEKGGGNPLFLVEIMHTLEAEGLLAAEVDWSRVGLDSLNLPDTVQGLLLAQIDRLAVEARHTLQMASVIGRNFLYRVLDAITAGQQQLDQQLDTLEHHEHIQKESQSEQDAAYIFRHVLIQESAYSTLLYERRRAYHRQVAEAMERLFPWHIGEQVGLLAFHYERADDAEKAIGYYLHAADQARLLYANEEAEALYRKVLNLLDRLEVEGGEAHADRRAKTYLKLAQVRANALDFEGAQEFYNQAFELLEQLADTEKASAEHEHVFHWGVFEHGPLTLDPGLIEGFDESVIIDHLFEGLVELDTELNVIPAMAQRWHVSENGHLYRFELRPGLTWSDSVPLTAHDFVFAWRRNLHPDTGAGLAHLLYLVQGAEEYHQGQIADFNLVGIRAVDDLTLEIHLKVPAGYFPYLLARPITYPQPAHRWNIDNARWSQPENLVNNGPFRLSIWQPNQNIQLERNPFYRGFATGNINKVQLVFVDPYLDDYLKGQIDWCRVDDRNDMPVLYPNETFLIQYLSTFFVGFACHTAPFNQKLVRQAFAKAINQEELVHQIWAGVQKPALGGIIPPLMPGYSPEIGLTFDPIIGRALLQEAGYDSGNNLPSLTLASLAGFSRVPTYLQNSWREHLGVNVQLVEDMPFAELVTKLAEGSIQLALIGYEIDYPDPDNILRVLFHSTSAVNYFGWHNDHFDQLVERAMNVPHHYERFQLYHQADRFLVAEETAVVPLYYWHGYGLLNPRLKIDGADKVIRGGAFKFKNILAT